MSKTRFTMTSNNRNIVFENFKKLSLSKTQKLVTIISNVSIKELSIYSSTNLSFFLLLN